MGRIRNRISMQDIADGLGMHVSTVSLGLRNDPRITPETRRRIQEEASRLGYRSDPLVSAWLRQVRCPQKSQSNAGLALVLGAPPERQRNWLSSQLQRVVGGARAEAQAIGFLQEEHWVHAPAQAAKLVKTLRYRGVRAVLLFDPEGLMEPTAAASFEEDFAVVVLMHAPGATRFHRVLPDTRANVALALTQLEHRGCRRVGLLLSDSQANAIKAEVVDAFLCHQRRLAPECRVPLPAPDVEVNSDALARWLRSTGVDAVLSADPSFLAKIEESGVRLPAPAHYCQLGVEGGELSQVLGVDTRAEEVGRVALRILTDLLTRNECGLPALPLTTLVPGIWVDPKMPVAERTVGSPERSDVIRARPSFHN